MDLNLTTISIAAEKTLLSSAVEAPFDLDINLPEYYPDIQRILCCDVQSNMHSVTMGMDRVTAEGNGVLRMLYTTEEKQLVAYEQSFPISRSVPFTSADPTAAATVSAKTEFVNCRATGQRRAGVHGAVSIRFTVLDIQQNEIVSGEADSSLQVRTEPIQSLSLAALTSRTFAMSEVVEVGSDALPIAHILRSSAAARIDSVKTIAGKLLMKGEVTTQILYAPPEDAEWVFFSHSMPISQIVESDGIAEKNQNDITLQIQSLDVVPKADGSGDQRLVEIALNIEAVVRSSALIETKAVVDAYSVEGKLLPKYADMPLVQLCEQLSETIQVKQTLENGIADAAQVLDVRTGPVQTVFRMQDDTAVVECTAALGILYRDAGGEAMYADRTICFTYSRILPQTAPDMLSRLSVQIAGCKVTLDSENHVQVRMEALMSGSIYLVRSVRALLSAQVEPLSAAQEPAMTIYFTDENESVWEIARRYRTTPQAVMEENGLSEDVVGAKRMLVIPTV